MKKKKARGVDPPTMKYAMSGLLVLTAIIHGVTGALMQGGEMRLPILVFGALFLAAGAYVRAGGRTAILLGMALAAVGLAAGGTAYLREGGPAALPLMFLIDALILAAGGVWLNLTRKKT